jgi:D-aminopeptidase
MDLNLITDIAGVRVGSAHDARLASGATAVVFDAPTVASIAVHGGAPAARDTELLAPHMTVEKVDAFVLSGGSAFGLDAAGGVMAQLASVGRGYPVRSARVPIVPGAALFDLTNGGDKAWGRTPPYWELGYRASEAAAQRFELGTAGAGFGATTLDLKGGLGSASAVTSGGYRVGALVACNAVGRATRGASPYFWAAPYERDGEFGGLGSGPGAGGDHLVFGVKNDDPANTNLAVVVTDAPLTKAQVKRLAVAAQDGFALALRPAHAPTDGDLVFAAATGAVGRTPGLRDFTEIGMYGAECVARSVARAVYEATPLAVEGAQPSWRGLYRR